MAQFFFTMALKTMIFVIFILILTQVDGARILAVFPLPFISHQIAYRPLTQELARRGHEVVVVTTDPIFTKDKSPANFKEIDIHNVTYDFWQKMYKITSSGKPGIAEHMKLSFGMINSLMEMLLQTKPIQELMNEENFDLLIIQACVRPTLFLNHVFKTPVIQVSSFGPMNFDIHTMGMPWHPLLYPLNTNRKVYNLTVLDKAVELWNNFWMDRVFDDIQVLENEMAKRVFGANVPTIRELKNNVDLLLLNVHPLWESNRPAPPGVVYVGGMHVQEAKEIPSDLKEFLDSSKNGVIYISFGTNVKPSLLAPDKLLIFIKVLSELPYDVLWKYDADVLPVKADNIKIHQWLPQQDVLRHHQVRVFITQGGLQSTQEAIEGGVPLIGIPFVTDQWFNTEKYVHYDIGVQLNIHTLNEDELIKAIDKVINNDSYRQNIVKLRELMNDQPQHPLDRAVWWTEHVLRHGGAKHLRSPAANISWTQFLELELMFYILAMVSVMAVAIFVITYKLFMFIVAMIPKLRKVDKRKKF